MKNNTMQNILGHIRRADQDFDLIQDGDKVAVGLSGGKDSLTLVAALSKYKKFGIKNFDVVAITVDCTDGETDFTKIAKFCNEHGVEHHVEPSQIFKVIFDIRKEKSPCSLCSKMRRGALNSAAVKLGCNKVALGHHGDDMVETFLLSLMYEGRLSTFKVKTYMDKSDVTTIRPLIYAKESEIISHTTQQGYPILNNCCIANGFTQREYMKNLVKRLNSEIPNARERMQDAVIYLTSNDIKCKN